MARRKRLDPTIRGSEPDTQATGLETKAANPNGWVGYAGRRAPIADVARDAAGQAALEEVTQALEGARSEGRLIQTLPLSQIALDHLHRDRMVLDEDEMSALRASLEARGQQTPVEVVPLGPERYGLISGLRRVQALKDLGRDDVLALIRPPQSASDAYVAMVEENEIRANLSFYERARIAAQAAEAGVYPSADVAVQSLFVHASASKRSKILSFVTLHAALGSVLQFPTEIPEKLGLALVKAIDTVPTFGVRLKDALRKTPAPDAAAERQTLERALARAKGSKLRPAAPETEDLGGGLTLKIGPRRAVLSGAGVDADLLRDLRAWLAAR